MKIPSASPATLLAVIAIALCAYPHSTRAEITLSNLGQGTFLQIPVAMRYTEGQQFLVGPTDSIFKSVTVTVGPDPNAGPPNGRLYVILYADQDGVPGATLLNLSGNEYPSSSDNYTYTGSYLLNANTNYWIVLASDSGGFGAEGNYVWYSSAGSTWNPQLPGWDGGLNAYSYEGGSWTTSSNYNLTLQIDADAVPEPSAFVLLGATLLGVTAFRLSRGNLRRIKL